MPVRHSLNVESNYVSCKLCKILINLLISQQQLQMPRGRFQSVKQIQNLIQLFHTIASVFEVKLQRLHVLLNFPSQLQRSVSLSHNMHLRPTSSLEVRSTCSHFFFLSPSCVPFHFNDCTISVSWTTLAKAKKD